MSEEWATAPDKPATTDFQIQGRPTENTRLAIAAASALFAFGRLVAATLA
jgi:hypothetical protein